MNEEIAIIARQSGKTYGALIDYATDLQQRVEKLNNILNELEEYIGQKWYISFDNESIEFKVARDILNKLKALKDDNK